MKTVLEIPGEGYPFYRIPGIVALPDGDMLAYYECRRGGDISAIDVCMRRSSDGGRTFGERVKITDGKGRNCCNNPVMTDGGDKLIYLRCENYHRVFVSFSYDGGRSFSAEKEITDQIDRSLPSFFWSVVATGPGHGTRLSDGRIIVPVWFGTNRDDIFAHHPSVTSYIFSDDGGENWAVGRLFYGDDPSESCVTELCGRICFNIRSNHSGRGRLLAFSDDGGDSWTEPGFRADLPDPVCFGGSCSDGKTAYFTNCRDRNDRINLTLSTTRDFVSWNCYGYSCDGGYSDVCVCGGVPVVFYECGGRLEVQRIEL